MKHRIIDERAELWTLSDAAEWGDADPDYFQYFGYDEWFEPRLAKVHNAWYDVHDMVRARPEWASEGWHAEHCDTFFSALVFAFLDGDDDGFVRVGEYVS